MGKVTEVAGSRVTALRPPDGVDGHSRIPTGISAFLTQAALEHRALIASGALKPFHEPRNANTMLDAFKRSSYFGLHVYPAAVAEALKPDGDLTSSPDSSRFAGFLFENLAYLHTAARFAKEDKLVLTPAQTHEFFTLLYPDRQVIEYPYNQKCIASIYQPDGLIVDPWTLQITGMVEYKLHNGQQDFESQTGAFYKERRIHPEFFGGSQFHFITPNSFQMQPYHTGTDIEFATVPISRSQLTLFQNEIYQDYSPQRRGATLADMVSRRETQLGLMKNRQRRGEPLTTEQTVYMRGVRKQFVPLQVSA
jgi:hypothetical protein